MSKIWKQMLSLVLAMVMVLSTVPVQAFATETEPSSEPTSATEAPTEEPTEADDGTDVNLPTDTPTEAPTEHTHEYASEVTTEADCTTEGVKTFTCSCGNSYTEAIPATGHTYENGVCACGETEPTEAPSLSGETRKIYYYNVENWDEVYAAWSFDEEYFEDAVFPGEKLTAEGELENVWVISVPVEADGVLFTDGIEVTEELLAEEEKAGLSVIHEIEVRLSESRNYYDAEADQWLQYTEVLAAHRAAQETEAPTEAPEATEDEAVKAVQAMIDALPTTFASQEEVDNFWDVTAVELDTAIEALTAEQQEQLDLSRYDTAIDAAASFTNPEFDDATTWADATLEVLDGKTTPIALINAVSWSQQTGRTYTIKKPDGSEITTNGSGLGVTMKDSAELVVTTGEYTVQYVSGYPWSSTTNTKTVDVEVFYNVKVEIAGCDNGSVTYNETTYNNGDTIRVYQGGTITLNDVEGYNTPTASGAGTSPTSSGTLKVTYTSVEAAKHSVTLNVVNGEYAKTTPTLSATGEVAEGTIITINNTAALDNTDNAKYNTNVSVNGATLNSDNTFTVGSDDVIVTVTFSAQILNGNTSAEINYTVGMTTAQLKEEIFNKVITGSTPASVTADAVTVYYWPYYSTLLGSGFCNQADERRELGQEAPNDSYPAQYYNFGERGADVTEKVVIEWNGLSVTSTVTLKDLREAPVYTIADNRDVAFNAYQGLETWPNVVRSEAATLTAAVLEKVTTAHDGTPTVEFKDENGDSWQTYAWASVTNAGNVKPGNNNMNVRVIYAATSNYPEMTVAFTVNYVDSRQPAKIELDNQSIKVDTIVDDDVVTAIKNNVKVTDNQDNEVSNATIVVEPNTGYQFGANEVKITVTSNGEFYIPNTTGITETVTLVINKYTITFVDENGNTIGEPAQYEYGTTADKIVPPTAPAKADSADGQFRYEFKAWDPELETVTKDATYKATYNPITKQYDVTFKHENGDVLAGPTKVEYGKHPAYSGSTPSKEQGSNSKPYAFVGWTDANITSNDLDDFTVTGDLTLTAVFEEATGWLVTFKNGETTAATRFVNTDKNETTVSDLPVLTDPTDDERTFVGWFNGETEFTAENAVTADLTVTAKWVDDKNNNNVDDGEETITINVTADEYVEWSVSGADKIGETNDYLFDSTGDKQITITAAPKAQPNTYTKYELTTFTVNGETKTSPAAFTIADGETYNVVLGTTTTTLTLKADQTVYVNKNALSDRITGLKEKIIAAVVGETADPTNYQVVVDATFDYDLDNLSGLSTTGLATALLGNEAKVKITDKTTGLYGNATVTLADSRLVLDVQVEDLTIEAKTEPADVKDQVKAKVSIKATDPQTGAETTVAVSDSYVSYSPSYAWPADAETKEFTVTISIAPLGNATYQAYANKTLKLTCTDTTILYTITYTDGVNEEPLYSAKHAEFTATPTIDEPTRTYYNFAGWTPSVAESVTADATYTATWKPVTDNNHNDIADEEETYTVIYTDGVADAEIFADSKTEDLAYGAATPDAPTVPERDGWNFKGWDVNPIPATVSAPTSGNTITYTAQWTEAWVVSFVGNTYNTPAEVENGNLVAEPTDTWDDDHDFLGWYNGDEKYDFAAPVESNLTLTAKWREDYNHNDIDDATEAHYTVIYKDGETELAKFENVLVGLSTPAYDADPETEGNQTPTKEHYKFNGWTPEVTDTVTNHVTYVAQWLNDTNGNDVDDALETITITVNKANEADKITVTGAKQIEGTNNWVYDSKTVTELTIKAAPTTHLDSLKRISDTYVKAITSQGAEVELTYDASFAATATVILTGPVAGESSQYQSVEVTFAEAEFVYSTERVMNYHDKMTEVKNDDLYNIVVDTPDLGEDVTFTAQYKAREAMTHSVAIDALDLNDTVKWLLKTITGKDTLTFDMPELWLEVDLEGNDELNEKIKNAVSLEQSVKTNLTSEKLLGLLEVFNDNGGLLGGGVSAAWNELQKILTSVTDAAIYYDAHVFGYNDTGAETVTEVIKVTYKSNALYIEGETDVTLKDMRATSYLNGSNVSVIYKDYTDEELAALIGAYVADANGTIIEDAEIVCLDITDPYSMEGSNVSDIAYKLTFTFDGDETYKPSKNTFTVTVTKASSKLDLPNLIVEYGAPYDPIEQATITLGNKYGEKSDITNSLIKFLIGLDMADLDVNADGVTGLNGQIQLVIPEDMLGVLSSFVPEDGLNMTLSDLTKFLEPLEDSSIAILKQALEAIQGITETGDIRININGKYPTDIGAYLYGAVSTNPNYETAFDVGYIVIKPDADRVYLDWNYNDTNGIFTPELLQYVNLGASAFNDEAFTAVNDTATDKINNLFFGLNINGELVAELYNQEIVDHETLENTLNNGAYTQMAFIAEFGNEMHYAVPIVRAFAIVPNTVTVTIVDQEDTDFIRTFDNEKQELDVKLSYAGSAITPDEKYLTVTYTGIQTNTQVVESTDSAPIHAGIYLVTAFYNETDANGKVIAVGADVKTLTIMPAPSETVVDDKIITKGETIDLMTDMIHVTVDSGVTSPDMTIISAQIASDGSFDEIGWDAVTGNVNIDVPDWLDAVLTEYAPEIKDGMNAAEFVEKLNAILPDILSKLEEAEASNEIINSLTNLVNNLTAALENVPDDATLTFNNVEDMDFDNVGVYVITAIVTDSDHMPSADSGLLVVQPDVKQVYLKWNYEDENGIWTRELLNHADLLATAYNEAEFITEDANATAEITYKFIGVDKTGELKIFESSDANELPNGAYIQLAYIEWESSGYMTVSDLLARPVVLIPGNAEVTMESKNVDFDNTAKKLEAKVVINGNTINAGDHLTITYTGIQTNGKTYGPTTEAPVHAGVYSVVAEYKDYTDGNSIAHYGVAAAFLTIEPAESEIAVTGGTVVYDGKGHTAAVTATGSGVTEPDYTLISGGAYVSGDIDEVGVDAFHGNVNIDFPAWLDKALAEHEFKTEGVNTAYLIDFICSYRDDVLELIPVETLVKLGVAEEEINAYIAKLNDYIDELLAILEKLPAGVALTFDNNVTYTEPGYYFYYGIVTDSDHYPAADTGLLVIEKKDILFDLLDTTVTWNGKGQMVDINNPENANYTAVVIDRKNNTINIILDEDAQYALNKIAEILGVEFDGDVQMSTILEKYSGQEVADAIVMLIGELEQLELPTEIQKVVAAVKAELETLPEKGTVILNGQMPTEVGSYEVYAISYSQYFKTVASEAVLEIVPAKVKVSLDDKAKVYGDVDPELTCTVKYFDHEGKEMTGITTDVTAVICRKEGEDVGRYAITAEVTVADTNFMIAEVVDGTLTITPKAITVNVEDATKIYGEEDPTFSAVANGLVGSDVLNITFERESGEDVGEYTINAFVKDDNYTITVVPGKLTINPKEITAADVKLDGTLTYNGTEQTQGVIVTDGITYKVTGNTGTNAGNYTLTVTGTGNYTGTVELKWTIAKAKVTVTVVSDEITYGDEIPTVELTYSNELAEDELNISMVWNATKDSDVGTYGTNFTWQRYENWDVEHVGGELTIKPKTITAADVKLDGALTYNGTEQTQGIIVTDGITYEVTGNTGTNAGEYTLTVTGTGNYTGTVELLWTIAKADVKVAVDNVSKVYGEDDPTLTAVTTGTFGSDVLDVKVSRAEGENAGTYDITATVAENGNYNVTVVAGKLTITPATITIEVKDATKVCGEADPENKAIITVTSGKVSESELNVVVTRETGEAAGEYAYKVVYTESDNYTVIVTAGKLTITEKEDDKTGLYPIPFNPNQDTTGTIAPGATVEIDGVPYILDENCIAWVDHIAAKIATTYKYHVGGNAHETYPTNMYVWYLTIVDKDSDGDYDEYTAERIEELDDFFKYEGTSIRINFSSNGIRFFTSVNADKCEALMNGTLLNGPMAGYQMTRTGTLYKKYTGSDSSITFANGVSSDVYGGKAGNDFRVFSTVGSRNWFTGMLTGLDGDAETLDMDIQSRPFAILELNGETIVLYGGTVQRSIYYVATQNRDYWATGTVYDNYVESLIATVEEARKKS